MKHHRIHYDIKQGSPEWLALRMGKITGTDVDEFCLEPIKLGLTIPQICEVLNAAKIDHKKSAKRDELVAMLTNPHDHMTLSSAARTLILAKIDESATQDPWQLAQSERENKKLEYLIPIQRGKAMEPAARAFYQRKTGRIVTEAGFIESIFGGHGMSPDGIVVGDDDTVERVLEIKCPMPPTHRRWLLDHYGKGTVPSDHYWQCQMAMVCGECDYVDFLSFCPGEAPLLVELNRSSITDQLEEGLRVIRSEREKLQSQLADMWDAEYGGADGSLLLSYSNGNPMFSGDGTPLDDQGIPIFAAVTMEGGQA